MLGRTAKVKAICKLRTAFEPMYEVYYDFAEDDVVAVCPMVFRGYAVDEMDMWVKFNQHCKENLTNVIWL